MKFPTHGLMAPDAGAAGGGDGGGKVAIGGPQAVFGGMGEPTAAKPEVKTAAPEKPTRSGVVETPAVVETKKVETPVVETPVVETPVVETPATTTPQGVVMSDAQLQKLASTLVEGIRPAQVQQPQTLQPLTPEQQAQFDKEFAVVRVTPELFQGILGFAPENPQQLKALETFAHGIVRQASAMTMFKVQQLAQEREGALTERLSPVMQAHQAAQAKQVEETFFGKFPDLKDFGPLVAEVALAEKARGTKFESPEKALESVASKARALLGNRAPSGSTTQSTQGKQPTRPSMPSVSTGGRSGGSPQSSQQPASGPKAVFGDLDGGR